MVVSKDQIREVSVKLMKIAEEVKMIFHIAPAIVPYELESLVFLDKEKIPRELEKELASFPDNEKQDRLNLFESLIDDLAASIKEIEQRVQARQQPDSLPRREGARPIKQFRARRGEWS